MKTTSLFIALFIVHCLLIIAKAQNPKIDSLENLLQQHTQKDTLRINLLNKCAKEIEQIDQEKSIKYADEALELASMLNFRKGKAESLYQLAFCHYLMTDYQKSLDYWQKSFDMYEVLGNRDRIAGCLKNIGIIYERKGNYPLSLEYCQKALKISEEVDNKQEIASCLKNIGIIYMRKGNYPLSLKYYQKALKTNEKIGNKEGKANCLNNIGITYQRQGNYPLSLEYHQKALKISEENGSEVGKVMSLNNIGLIYEEQSNYELALTYYQKALKINEKTGQKQGRKSCLNNIGTMYFYQSNYELALTYFQKALEINEEIGDKNGMATAMNNIGSIYYRQANFALALDYYQNSLKIGEEINNKIIIVNSCINLGAFYLGKLDFKKALEYTQKSLIIAIELELLNQQKQLYLQMYKIYTAIKNDKKALENYVLYKELYDSIFKEKNIKKIIELEYQYEFDKEKQAIELEQQKKDALIAEKLKHQKTAHNFIILFAIFLLLVIYIIYRNFKNKQVAYKMKLRFFTNISHELRTPLTLIKSPLERILKTSNTADAINSQLQLALNNTNKLKTLVDQILDFQKLDEHQIVLNLSEFDVVAFCNEIVSSFEGYCYQSKCKLIFKTNIGKANLKFDQGRLQSIINNLLSNAFKFNKEGGLVQFNLEINDKQLKLEISDTGIGIKSENIKRLGERYYQIEKSDFTVEGTGIGLAYVKELTEQMKGSMGISSTINKGTTVVVSLPCDEIKIQDTFPVLKEIKHKPQIVDQLDDHLSENINNLPCILIIEDNFELRLFLRDLFVQFYHVICAKDGQEGKLMALKHMPDLIISDIMMPGIRGNELCKMLKNDINTSHITIILFTAKAAPDSIVDGYDCGADDYIVKPFDTNLLLKKVKNIISTLENAKRKFSFTDMEQSKNIYSELDKKFLRVCMSIIKDNLQNSSFTVEVLAENINLHRRTLLRKFNALTGKSPSDLIRHTRMTQAVKLLHEKYRVNEVALMVGYEDTNRFSKAFKQFYGIPPSACS